MLWSKNKKQSPNSLSQSILKSRFKLGKKKPLSQHRSTRLKNRWPFDPRRTPSIRFPNYESNGCWWWWRWCMHKTENFVLEQKSEIGWLGSDPMGRLNQGRRSDLWSLCLLFLVRNGEQWQASNWMYQIFWATIGGMERWWALDFVLVSSCLYEEGSIWGDFIIYFFGGLGGWEVGIPCFAAHMFSTSSLFGLMKYRLWCAI